MGRQLARLYEAVQEAQQRAAADVLGAVVDDKEQRPPPRPADLAHADRH